MPIEYAFELLESSSSPTMPAIAVVFGDDSTLRAWSKNKLLFPDGEDSQTDCVEIDGEQAEWKDVRDELQTGSLFSLGQPRMVVIRDADKMVSKSRSDFEDYVAKPSSVGRLLIELKTFPGNTRLYKAINKTNLIVQCAIPQSKGRGASPDLKRLSSFLCSYVAPRHHCSLKKSAADSLIELSGQSLGMLDTDIAKLALYADAGGEITDGMVRQYVGGWRSKTMWEIVDAAAEGKAGEALRHLDRMIASGEKAFALLPQISWSLRRMGLAAAAIDHAERTGNRITMHDALQQAGFRPFDIKKAEGHLRKIGRGRAQRMLGWLLEADLKLKGTHSAEDRARWVLEELFLRLAA